MKLFFNLIVLLNQMTKDSLLNRNQLNKDAILSYRNTLDHIIRENMTFEQRIEYLKETLDENRERKCTHISLKHCILLRYKFIFEMYK